jgi:hypothetical protein
VLRSGYNGVVMDTMTPTFEIVTIAVTVVGIVLSLTRFFQPFRVMRELGRGGAAWFDRIEDHPLDEQPDGSANDPPIPHRPLRPRL